MCQLYREMGKGELAVVVYQPAVAMGWEFQVAEKGGRCGPAIEEQYQMLVPGLDKSIYLHRK